MNASKYLPPFTPEERGAVPSSRPHRTAAEPDLTAEGEVTYADFLGDAVDD